MGACARAACKIEILSTESGERIGRGRGYPDGKERICEDDRGDSTE
jgi:hypothetical protein